jgi:hypothetical protein
MIKEYDKITHFDNSDITIFVITLSRNNVTSDNGGNVYLLITLTLIYHFEHRLTITFGPKFPEFFTLTHTREGGSIGPQNTNWSKDTPQLQKFKIIGNVSIASIFECVNRNLRQFLIESILRQQTFVSIFVLC